MLTVPCMTMLARNQRQDWQFLTQHAVQVRLMVGVTGREP